MVYFLVPLNYKWVAIFLVTTTGKTARKKLLEEFANIVGFDLNREAQSRKEITDSAVVPILAGFFP